MMITIIYKPMNSREKQPFTTALHLHRAEMNKAAKQ